MDNTYLWVQHYLNKLEPTQQQQVEDWINEADQNREAYQTYIKLWLASSKAKPLESVDTKKAWHQLKQRVKPTATMLNIRWTMIARVAAVVAVLIGTYWWSIANPSYDHYVINNTDKLKTVTLFDGTKVTLNRGARLDFFSQIEHGNRQVKLIGNAFFEVTKNPDAPFVIETKHTEVKVLGTSFDIHETSIKTTVTVATGKVQVSSRTSSDKLILTPDQRAIYADGKLVLEKSASANHYAWKTEKYSFVKEPLVNVFVLLQKQFDFKFSFKQPKLAQKTLTASFEKESLAAILKIIELSCQVKIYKKNNQLIITQ